MDLVKFVEEQAIAKKDFPAFKSGDTVSVHYKIREGNKERIQIYQGRCRAYLPCKFSKHREGRS